MDPFQARLGFLSALQRLNASLPTIQRALSLIVEYGPNMHDELWACILDQCKAGSVNRRINLLFLIDAIFTDDTLSPAIRSLFRSHLERDLYTLFDLAVPEGRWDALLNIPAVSKILSTWKARMVLDNGTLQDLETMLEVRKATLYTLPAEQRNFTHMPDTDIMRRIEEDRERHKRLREKAWVLPPTAFSHQSLFGVRPEQLDPTYLTRTQKGEQGGEEADADRVWTTQDLDFSQTWDETSDFNDDDVEQIHEDDKVGWVHQQPLPLPPQNVVQTASTPAPVSSVHNRPPPTAPASMRSAQRSS